ETAVIGRNPAMHEDCEALLFHSFDGGGEQQPVLKASAAQGDRTNSRFSARVRGHARRRGGNSLVKSARDLLDRGSMFKVADNRGEYPACPQRAIAKREGIDVRHRS